MVALPRAEPLVLLTMLVARWRHLGCAADSDDGMELDSGPWQRRGRLLDGAAQLLNVHWTTEHSSCVRVYGHDGTFGALARNPKIEEYLASLPRHRIALIRLKIFPTENVSLRERFVWLLRKAAHQKSDTKGIAVFSIVVRMPASMAGGTRVKGSRVPDCWRAASTATTMDGVTHLVKSKAMSKVHCCFRVVWIRPRSR